MSDPLADILHDVALIRERLSHAVPAHGVRVMSDGGFDSVIALVGYVERYAEKLAAQRARIARGDILASDYPLASTSLSEDPRATSGDVRKGEQAP